MKVLVICPWAFNPGEMWPTLRSLKAEGVHFEVASTKSIIEEERARTETPRKFRVKTLDEVDANEFDGLIVIGGHRIPREKLYYDTTVRAIVEAFERQNKPIAAICAAVPVIRYILKGRRCTVFPYSKCIVMLQREGAIIEDASIVEDGNVITAQSESCIEAMIERFVRKLRGR